MPKPCCWLSPTRTYLPSITVDVGLEVRNVDVPATSLVMYVIHIMHDVTSRCLEVDAGRPLVEVGHRCPPLAYSKRPMRCHMMLPRTDVELREVTMFSMMYSMG